MVSSVLNVFSSSEREHLKRFLKKPDKDFQEIISLLEKKVQESNKQLSELNEKYHSLVDGLSHVGIGIDIVSNDYEILFQNQVLKERFGDCKGKNCYRSYMDLGNPCEFCPMEEALKYNKVEHTELNTADGRSYELISAPYPNRDGTIDKVAEVVIDITERKGIEQKLRESEEKYRILTEQSLMGIFIIQDGRFKYINQAVSDMNGYTIEEMLNWTGKDIAKTIYSEDLENIMNKLKRSEQGDLDDFSSSIFRIITKNGKLKWVEEYNKRIEFQGFPASLITLIDITNRVESEYKLRESEEKYRSLINNISDIIYELDINGKCTYASNQLFEISGFHPDEMIGQNVFEFLHPDDLLNIAEKVKETFNSGTRISADFRLKHKKGYYVPVSSNFNMIDTNGDLRLIGVLRDNTEKKQAELKLRESEEEFRSLNSELETILDIIPGMLFCKDRNDVVTRVNQNFADSLDLKKEEIIGKTTLDLFPKDQAEKFRKDDLEIYNRGKPKLNIEESADFPDGKIWAITNKTPYHNEKGEIIGIIGLAIDITDRKTIEEKLKKTERRLRSLIEQTSDAVFCYEFIPPIPIDLPIEEQVKLMYDCVLVDCNLVCAKSYGADRVEDVIGRKLTDLFGSTPSSLDKLFRDMIKGGYRITDGLGFEKIPDAEDRYFLNNGYGVIEKGKILRIWGTFRDITTRIKAEKKLKETERYLSNIFSSIQDGICVLDKDYNIISYNPKIEEWYSQPKPITGKKCFQVFRNRIEPCEDCKCQNILDTGENFCESEIYKEINGKIDQIFDVYTFPLYDQETGSVDGIIKYMRDITEHKKAEQKLKESEEKYRTLTEQSFLGITIVQDDIVQYVNKQLAHTFGYTVQEIMAWKKGGFLNVIYPEDRKLIAEQARKKQLGESDIIDQYQFRGIKKNGDIIWLEVFSKSIDYRGKPSDFVTIHDITDEKISEQKIKESEEKFRTITEESLIGICIIQDNLIKYMNQEMSDMFGYSIEEVLNWEPGELFKILGPDTLELVKKQLKKKQTGDPDVLTHYKAQMINKKGELFWVDNISKTITFEGRPADLVTQIDITERLTVQQELIKLNQLKSELLRRTSHELKTPLVSIKGFAELLLQVHKDKLDAFVISTLNEIKQGCLRLESLIGDILKTAELESGAIQLNKSEEDLSFLVRVCVNEIKGFSKLRNHTINLELHENLVAQFEKEQIHQVISNILTNAVKYTPPSGIIEIKSEMRDGFIVFSIKDNGIGFTEEEKTRIFKQFGKIERYGQGLDIIAEGSGFGLFISKKIIELHGGNIWVESEGRNKGSTFYFSLPIIRD